MKPGTMLYLNKKIDSYIVTKHSFDLWDKPTFCILDMNQEVPRTEIIVDIDNIELYSKFYNKIFGNLQLTLDLDNV